MAGEAFDYAAYLAVKKAIDDVSLNPAVWQAMATWLARRRERQSPEPMRILEIGAGTGAMIQRFRDAGLLRWAVYTALEMEPRFRTSALESLAGMFPHEAGGFQVKEETDGGWAVLVPETPAGTSLAEVRWITGDATDAPARFKPASFDLLVGHAVIDLLPVPACLPELLACLKPHGAAYFSVNYAGKTAFLPIHPFDETLCRAYHDHMDRRFTDTSWRASQTGRRLGTWLRDHGHTVLAEGPSNWRLPPRQDRGDGEVRFIANILDTIESALNGLPGLPEWLQARRRQLAPGVLGFYAENCDCFVLGGKPYMGTRDR